MLKKIDHIGIAVRHLADAAAVYEGAFGLEAGEIETIPGQKVRVQKFRIGGVRIEFLEPISDDSPVSKFLAKRGEGVHHLCYAVSDLDQAVRELKSHEMAFTGEPVIGSDGKPIIFIHPGSANGVLIELVEERQAEQNS